MQYMSRSKSIAKIKVCFLIVNKNNILSTKKFPVVPVFNVELYSWKLVFFLTINYLLGSVDKILFDRIKQDSCC